MATRYNKTDAIWGRLPSGYEGVPSPDLKIEPSGPEDVDRAFFEYFNSQLPLFYKDSESSGQQLRVPVIFSTGERFAVGSKKEPNRDKNGALMLPLVSITRSGIEQEHTKGGGVSDRFNEMVVRNRISPGDPVYQAAMNALNLKNTKFSNSSNTTNTSARDDLLSPNLKTGHIYEVFVIPSPKYYTVKYEVTFWGQYMQQVNSMMTSLMGSYIQPGGRTARIESKKGYWYVAYFDQAFNIDNNFSDFSENERVIKATIAAEVPSYLVLPTFPGSPNGIRSYLSAPEIAFETVLTSDVNLEAGRSPEPNLDSGKEKSYILSDIETTDSPPYSDQVGIPPEVTAVAKVDTKDRLHKIERLSVDPRTGEPTNVLVRVKDANSKKGETVIMVDDFLKLVNKS